MEAQEGWGGRGLMCKVSGQEGQAQSGASSSVCWGQVVLGGFCSREEVASGSPGNPDGAAVQTGTQ